MTKIRPLTLNQYQLDAHELDSQHQYFEQLILRLSESLNQSDNLGDKESTIIELNSFARFHFISEENMMKLTDFPDYKAHKIQHLKLLDDLERLEVEMEKQRSEEMVDNAIKKLIEWFSEHTTTMDKHFSDFLQNHK